MEIKSRITRTEEDYFIEFDFVPGQEIKIAIDSGEILSHYGFSFSWHFFAFFLCHIFFLKRNAIFSRDTVPEVIAESVEHERIVRLCRGLLCKSCKQEEAVMLKNKLF